MERGKASGVLGRYRDDLVAPLPVYRGDAEVHTVGSILSKGEVLGVGPDEAGRGLAGACCYLGLAGEEAGALEVGRAGAEIIGGPHGFDHGVGGWTAAAGVQIDVVVLSEGRERLAGDARLPDDMRSFRV
jgi:hypothetical protein